MEKELIKEKLQYQKSLIQKLKIRLNKYKLEKDEEEKETLFAAMAKFSEEIVESAIKINNRLLEDNKDFASSYYETFSKLRKHYEIDEEIIDKLARTTGFRNRISHEYDKINPEITVISFENIINLYLEYIKIILNIIEK